MNRHDKFLADRCIGSEQTGPSKPWDRRDFLTSIAAVAGSAGLFGLNPDVVAAEPPPETTRLRLTPTPAICLAPQ